MNSYGNQINKVSLYWSTALVLGTTFSVLLLSFAIISINISANAQTQTTTTSPATNATTTSSSKGEEGQITYMVVFDRFHNTILTDPKR
jgi:hypothetical protein